jgi:hypothetical protein
VYEGTEGRARAGDRQQLAKPVEEFEAEAESEDV